MPGLSHHMRTLLLENNSSGSKLLHILNMVTPGLGCDRNNLKGTKWPVPELSPLTLFYYTFILE